MRKLLFILSLLFCISGYGQRGFYLHGFNAPALSTIETKVSDAGPYEAFPFTALLNDGVSEATTWKRSASHAAKGPMMFALTTDGGRNFSSHQIVIDGVPIECAALSMVIDPGPVSWGRIIILFQDDEVYTSIKYSYSDDKGETWATAQTISFPAGYSTSPSPVLGKITPEGNIMFGYYQFGSGTDPAIIGFLVSTNHGATITVGPTIFSHHADAPSGTFGDWKGHEFGFECIENTGVDSTSKWIAFVRVNIPDAGGTYFMFYRSLGGATWETDMTEDAGFGGPFSRHLLYSFLTSNSPIDIKLHKGTVYVLCGERHLPDYQQSYITATPAGAWENKFSNWSAKTTQFHYNAETLGESIDCGYPLFWEDHNMELWVVYYDVSTLTADPLVTTRRCFIKWVKAAD